MNERRAAGSWHRSLSRVLRSERVLIGLTVRHTATRTVPRTGTGDSPHRALRSPARSMSNRDAAPTSRQRGAQRSEASQPPLWWKEYWRASSSGGGARSATIASRWKTWPRFTYANCPVWPALYFQAARLLSLSQARWRPQYRPLAPRGAGAVFQRTSKGWSASCL
jgi:hypothetical protein